MCSVYNLCTKNPRIFTQIFGRRLDTEIKKKAKPVILVDGDRGLVKCIGQPPLVHLEHAHFVIFAETDQPFIFRLDLKIFLLPRYL